MKEDTKKIIDNLFNDNLDPAFSALQVFWERNILYCINEQWIQWMAASRSFSKRYSRMKGVNFNVPTPTNNIIRDHVRSMKALILNKKFDTRVWPNSDDQDDTEAATMAGKILQYLDAANDGEHYDEVEKVATMLCLTGTVFVRTFPETDNGDWAFKKNTGVDKINVATECILPFNVRVDKLGTKLRDKRFVGIQSLKNKEWVEDNFKKLINEDSTQSINYQKRLMDLVGEVGPWKGSIGSYSAIGKDYVTLKEVEFRPTKDYPDGRYVVMAGGTILDDRKELPIPATNGKWDYSLTDFHYFKVPGRFWSDPSVNDLISSQDSINRILQAYEINRRGLATPWVLKPVDTKLSTSSLDGIGVRVVEWDPVVSGGQRPMVQHASPLPESIMAEYQMHQQAAQDAAGDPKHVLRGKMPGSQTAGITVDILRDTAEQGHFPDIERFYRSLARVQRKKLILAQKVFTEARTVKIVGDGNNVEILTFKGSDLRNNTDVRLELSSGLSHTNAGKAAAIIQMANSGFFGDIRADQEMQNNLVKLMGLSLERSSNADMDRVKREHGLVKAGKLNLLYIKEDMPITDESGQPVIGEDGQPVMQALVIFDDPLFKLDDHKIHYSGHRMFAISREFAALDDGAKLLFLKHVDSHMAESQAEQQAQMQAQIAMNQPPPGPPQEPQGPQPLEEFPDELVAGATA